MRKIKLYTGLTEPSKKSTERKIEELIGSETESLSHLSDTSPGDICLVFGKQYVEEHVNRKLPFDTGLGAHIWHKGATFYWAPTVEYAQSNKFVGEYVSSFAKGFLNRVDYQQSAPKPSEPILITHENQSKDAIRDILRHSHSSFDFETSGPAHAARFKLLALSITTPNLATYVWDRMSAKMCSAHLREYFASDKAMVGHNIKYDAVAAKKLLNATISGKLYDTHVLWKLFNCNDLSSLDTCSYLVGMGGYKGDFYKHLALANQVVQKERSRYNNLQTELFSRSDILQDAIDHPEDKKQTYSYGLVPPEELIGYCAKDTITTQLLFRWIIEEGKKGLGERCFYTYNKVMEPAIRAFIDIECAGFMCDSEGIEAFRVCVSSKLDEIKGKLVALGLENPASSIQVRRFLFETLSLPPQGISDTTKEPSTGRAVLDTLAKKSNEVKHLLEFRRLSKLSDAYAYSLPNYIRQDARCHPTFRLSGARTGRISCSEPGLHQIPRSSTDEAKMLKDCFTCEPGNMLVACDFSQLELRVAAGLSKDPIMLSQFSSGEDFHLSTAKLVSETMWGIPPEDVTSKHRTEAKTFNFGLMYGMTDKGLADRLDCSKEKASKLREAILGAWKVFSAWVAELQRSAHISGYAQTIVDSKPARVRKLWALGDSKTKKNSKARFTAENGILNTMVQGSASDICLQSIADISKKLDKDCAIVMTVHDSIIVECPRDKTKQVAKTMLSVMQSFNLNGVPITVDCEVGTRWGSLAPLDEM